MSYFIVYSKACEVWSGTAYDADDAAEQANVKNYTTSSFLFDRGDYTHLVWLA